MSFKAFDESTPVVPLPSRAAKRPGDTGENQQSKRAKQTQSLPDKEMREHYDHGTLNKVRSRQRSSTVANCLS